MMADILDAEDIERIDVPASDRTDARDEAADHIEEMWPATLTEIADESGFSRQHVRNTLNTYFRPANGHEHMEQETGTEVELNIPGHERELLEAYRVGYRDGFQDGRES